VHLRAKGYNGLIIMVSALKEETEKTKTLDAGANAYIQKPITKEVLALHINHARSQTQA
jgi:DNA-binding response OmpR family regulator